MKHILLALVLMAGVQSLSAQSSWELVHAPTFENFLNDVHFVDAQTGWAVGSGGIVYKSIDGGVSWTRQAEGVTGIAGVNAQIVHFVDTQTGFIGMANGHLARTTDGGATWSVSTTLLTASGVVANAFRAIQFIDANVGYAAIGLNNNNVVLKTEDGGATWTNQQALTGANWLTMAFFDANRGVLGSNSRTGQFYTTNGGATWTAAGDVPQISNLSALSAIQWIDANTVIAVGQGNSFQGLASPMLKSTDGGATWVQKSITEGPTNNVYLTLDRLDDGTLVAGGHNRASTASLAISTDNGETWRAFDTDLNVLLQSSSRNGSDVLFQASTSMLVRLKASDLSLEILPLAGYSEIRDMQFVGDTGYMVNSSSVLYTTTNGTAWNYRSMAGTHTPGRGNNMLFLDHQNGIMQKSNRRIMRTSDGGNTWTEVLTQVPNNQNNRPGGVAFSTPQVGFAWASVNTGTNFVLFKTEDGGATWSEHQTFVGPANVSGELHFFDAATATIVGPRRWVYRSIDTGATWTPYTAGTGFPEAFSATADFRAVDVRSATTAWAVGNGFMAKTNDAGATWSWVPMPAGVTDLNFYAIAFVNDQFGYAGTFDGGVMFTEDGGATWNYDNSMKGVQRFITATTDGFSVYMGTTTGYVVAKEVISTSVETTESQLATSVQLDQNYPNPFNPTTTIRYALEASGDVVLSVYDMLGREVSVLQSGFMPAGTHTVSFNAAGLSSGVYLYRLSVSGQQVMSRTMMLVK
jgi:photosystem II stability/assembly factor-like uncharacterized protein